MLTKVDEAKGVKTGSEQASTSLEIVIMSFLEMKKKTSE